MERINPFSSEPFLCPFLSQKWCLYFSLLILEVSFKFSQKEAMKSKVGIFTHTSVPFSCAPLL